MMRKNNSQKMLTESKTQVSEDEYENSVPNKDKLSQKQMNQNYE